MHCIVSLSKTLYPLLSTCSTPEDRRFHMTEIIVDWDIKHQNTKVRASMLIRSNMVHVLCIWDNVCLELVNVGDKMLMHAYYANCSKILNTSCLPKRPTQIV